MIRDTQALEALKEEWHALRRSQGKLQINITASFTRGAWFLPQIADDIYALLLPFGFSVLEHVLQQMRDEALFACKSSQLKALMVSSQTAISWSSYQAVDVGRDIRNKLTHEQSIPSHSDTFRILDEIERELIGWKILDGPVKYEFTLSVGRAT
jgi:hypothetical protein